jgi:hypothetical protein
MGSQVHGEPSTEQVIDPTPLGPAVPLAVTCCVPAVIGESLVPWSVKATGELSTWLVPVLLVDQLPAAFSA